MNKKMTDGLRMFAEGLIELCAAAEGKSPLAENVTVAPEIKAAVLPAAPVAPPPSAPALVSTVAAPVATVVTPPNKAQVAVYPPGSMFAKNAAKSAPVASAAVAPPPEALTPAQLRKYCGDMITDLFNGGKREIAKNILTRFGEKLSYVPENKLSDLYAALGEVCPLPF
jgi:hypothetical protein